MCYSTVLYSSVNRGISKSLWCAVLLVCVNACYWYVYNACVIGMCINACVIGMC